MSFKSNNFLPHNDQAVQILHVMLHSLTEEIRSFAASLPGWLKAALKDLPELLVTTKEKGLCVCVLCLANHSISNNNDCMTINYPVCSSLLALDLFCKRIKRLTSLVQLAKVTTVYIIYYHLSTLYNGLTV